MKSLIFYVFHILWEIIDFMPISLIWVTRVVIGLFPWWKEDSSFQGLENFTKQRQRTCCRCIRRKTDPEKCTVHKPLLQDLKETTLPRCCKSWLLPQGSGSALYTYPYYHCIKYCIVWSIFDHVMIFDSKLKQHSLSCTFVHTTDNYDTVVAFWANSTDGWTRLITMYPTCFQNVQAINSLTFWDPHFWFCLDAALVIVLLGVKVFTSYVSICCGFENLIFQSVILLSIDHL